jgi:hypothetical protein
LHVRTESSLDVATNADVVEGQSHTITCSISGISDITGITWIKTSATGDKMAIVVGEDGKFSGGKIKCLIMYRL